MPLAKLRSSAVRISALEDFSSMEIARRDSQCRGVDIRGLPFASPASWGRCVPIAPSDVAHYVPEKTCAYSHSPSVIGNSDNNLEDWKREEAEPRESPEKNELYQGRF
jgi:hypothetical protein